MHSVGGLSSPVRCLVLPSPLRLLLLPLVLHVENDYKLLNEFRRFIWPRFSLSFYILLSSSHSVQHRFPSFTENSVLLLRLSRAALKRPGQNSRKDISLCCYVLLFSFLLMLLLFLFFFIVFFPCFLCCFHLKHFMAFCFSRRFIMIFMATLTLSAFR